MGASHTTGGYMRHRARGNYHDPITSGKLLSVLLMSIGVNFEIRNGSSC